MATSFLSAAVVSSLIVSFVCLNGVDCSSGVHGNDTRTVWVQFGSEVLLDCVTSRISVPSSVSWMWNRQRNRSSVAELNIPKSSENASIHEVVPDSLRTVQDVDILANGSLYINSVNRAHAGLYYCTTVFDSDNDTVVFALRLNYNIVSIATLNSIIVGLSSSSAFFLIAILIGLARYLAFVCSTKEKRKRKSIRAVLEAIQDYKSAQFDRFSAYRTAKMDQLSAFKSATIGHLSAFRDARVDQLRTYKQATVTSILAHLERMREHYAAQTARIKENCAMQAERLRESYSSRRGRFKDYRSHQVDRMRENYQVQAARIRDYGMQQMSRLREQYKTQQQHVLKLVELLDVGSCVSGVIEAECMRAESMIFDADIAFDFEAQPARVAEGGNDVDDENRSTDSDLSQYVSACGSITSDDADSIADKAICALAGLEDLPDKADPMADSLVFCDIDLEDLPPVDLEIAKCLATLNETCRCMNLVEVACEVSNEFARDQDSVAGGAEAVGGVTAFEIKPTTGKSYLASRGRTNS